MPDSEPAVRAGRPAAQPGERARGEQPDGKPAGSWRHPGWSWAAGRDWLVPSGVAVGTLLTGAAFGAIAAPTTDRVLAYIAVGAAGLAVLILTGVVYQGHSGILRRNGTAYVIRQVAADWSLDESRSFLAAAERQFARVIRVPGPGDLGETWDWPLGDGAQRWDGKVTELARCFMALHFDDNPKTPNGIFLWAWWAVAFGFGARVTAADRGLVLDVWQRPSHGRAGRLVPAPWAQRPHRFGPDYPAPPPNAFPPETAPQEFTWQAKVTITPKGPGPVAGLPGRAGLAVLLVRLGHQPWGPLPAAPAAPDPAMPVSLVLDDAAGLGTGGTFAAEIRELRIVPSEGTQFEWRAYPKLVAEVTAWIRRTTTDLDDRTLLLAAVVPPEVALGLGIAAAPPGQPGWPARLWPVVYQQGTGALVVPRLNLGHAAVADYAVAADHAAVADRAGGR
jgi:hypothetical protein